MIKPGADISHKSYFLPKQQTHKLKTERKHDGKTPAIYYKNFYA